MGEVTKKIYCCDRGDNDNALAAAILAGNNLRDDWGPMAAKGYSEYVKKHGYHFTDALAEHVSKMMENANGQQHTWTTSQVKKSMESLGLTIPSHVLHGDVTYLANMYYADLYPDPLKDEASCLRAAYKVANDPDGYEGMIFCRWTADAIGKAISINCEKFV
jgi:hypothetical protein